MEPRWVRERERVLLRNKIVNLLEGPAVGESEADAIIDLLLFEGWIPPHEP